MEIRYKWILIKNLFRYDGFSWWRLKQKRGTFFELVFPHYSRYKMRLQNGLTEDGKYPLSNSGVHRLKIRKRKVTIYTSRPGIIIGRKGENKE